MQGADLSVLDLVENEDDLVPPRKYPGFYPAIVKTNVDPERRQRLRVCIPAIHDIRASQDALPWAETSSMFAGNDRGIFILPEKGETVWVVFKQGDPDYPIWVGSWYGRNELPAEALDQDVFLIKFGGHIIQMSKRAGDSHVLIKTKDGHVLNLDDTEGKVEMLTKLGHSVVVDDTNSKVELTTIQGKKITLDDVGNKVDVDAALGSVNVTGAAGVNLGLGAAIGCNNLPACLFTGSPHSLGTGIPGPTSVKVPL